MFDRLGELRPDIGVATVAEVGLWTGEELFGGGGLMYRVAIGAHDVGGGVGRAADLGPSQLLAVTAKAGIEGLARCGLREGDDFGLVALALNMGSSGAVTAFAAFGGGVQFGIGGAFEVGVAEEGSRDIRMASTAGKTADVVGGKGLGSDPDREEEPN